MGDVELINTGDGAFTGESLTLHINQMKLFPTIALTIITLVVMTATQGKPASATNYCNSVNIESKECIKEGPRFQALN